MVLSPWTPPVVLSGTVTIRKVRGNGYNSILGVSFSQGFRGRIKGIQAGIGVRNSCVKTESYPGTHFGSGGLGKGDLRSLFWNIMNRH